jgi:uncharacterized protein YbaR (Trm112 family)
MRDKRIIRIDRPPYRCDCGKPLHVRVDPETGENEKRAYCRRCKRWFEIKESQT